MTGSCAVPVAVTGKPVSLQENRRLKDRREYLPTGKNWCKEYHDNHLSVRSRVISQYLATEPVDGLCNGGGDLQPTEQREHGGTSLTILPR
jgi:hypothetical protein